MRAPWLIARLHRLGRGPAVALTVGLLVGFTALDVQFGSDRSLAPFYLLPAGIAVWALGRTAGLLTAAASAVCWTVVSRFAPASGDPIAGAWGLLSNVLLFLLAALGLGAFRAAYVHERGLARVDELTGLANRHAFLERAEAELVRACRSGRPISMAFVDVDDFKLLNDQLGHAAGDGALRAVADELRGAVRAVDLVARIGGDEFAVLLPDIDVEGAAAAARRIRAELTLACSTGCVTWMDPPTAIDQLLRQADRLMYDVKHDGKGEARHEVVRRPPPRPRAVAAG